MDYLSIFEKSFEGIFNFPSISFLPGAQDNPERAFIQ
jgi:hypothetical protein